ncbi:MAG: methyltransferase domain-containing protein [bacterium]
MDLDSQLDALKRYYSGHADEYERMYYRDHSLRQRELSELAVTVRTLFTGTHVLEIACGTGYWTEIAADVAAGVVATDISDEMLDLAAKKRLPAGKVELRKADAYRLEDIPGDFDAGLACFWFSHVPRSKTETFLRGFHGKLRSGSVVFLTDNLYARGYGGELIRRPGAADTFKRRRLSDGTTHEILKNYYDAGELERLFAPHASDLVIRTGRFYWWLSYRVGRTAAAGGGGAGS